MRIRNNLCSCGSGRKTKHCCGSFSRSVDEINARSFDVRKEPPPGVYVARATRLRQCTGNTRLILNGQTFVIAGCGAEIAAESNYTRVVTRGEGRLSDIRVCAPCWFRQVGFSFMPESPASLLGGTTDNANPGISDALSAFADGAATFEHDGNSVNVPGQER